ncbi:DUF1127 domain-containing protein [Martelella radicis]|uniref:Uncharacterized protein YjiS (DUF1127 family) n=1 Tax=Martelella radicis TaxID=1397476 RepID=A0A7W6KI41_9HYPH|nr:DUF1127 domain-containing protein [Martelella radicis]MBB4121626.1 uncharacterized protein YjiS (DUF1127 family) [Martelella radicis]
MTLVTRGMPQNYAAPQACTDIVQPNAQMHGSCIITAHDALPFSLYLPGQNQHSTKLPEKFEETPMHPFDFTMKWFSYRRTRSQLRNLTAAELKDIGLLPGDIDRVAARAFR